MTATAKTHSLMNRLATRGIELDFDAVNTLRRAERTLHRWAELECGDSDDYKSYAIERDEKTGIPEMRFYFHSGRQTSYRVADREKGAIKRIKAICDAHGLHFFHQSDPRGCALYVSAEPLTDSNYPNGVAIIA